MLGKAGSNPMDWPGNLHPRTLSDAVQMAKAYGFNLYSSDDMGPVYTVNKAPGPVHTFENGVLTIPITEGIRPALQWPMIALVGAGILALLLINRNG